MVKKLEIPWAAWREPKYLELNFPDVWNVSMLRMEGADNPELTNEEIKKGILNPIGTPKLSEIANGKRDAVIVVDDMTRTTDTSKILPFVFEELENAKIKDNKITILLAVGAHRPMNKNDCLLKLGKQTVDKYNIENHHPYENLINLGQSKIGTPIDVNRTYYQADLKIAISGVIPHPLAGFGGGAKIILPGICGIQTLEANHSAGLRGIGAGIGRMTEIRKDIENIVDIIGLDFSINLIMNEIGESTSIICGNYRDAHRKAMDLANKYYKTKVILNNDICFFNSYPEDSELNQAVKSINFLMTAPNNILGRDGAVVLMSSSYEGKGYHSLSGETGAKLYSNYGEQVVWKAFIKKRRAFFFSPNISEADLYHYFPKSVRLFKEWNELISELEKIYGSSPKAAIIPTSIQLA
ncbi:MAG: lactate racemase domain-containing protein [Candidatus Hodarchaeota archaeon]